MNNIQNVKVSVIVPVYNVENYLRVCLDSLTNQTLRDIEIILINDCSTDNSAKICGEYSIKDNRIILFNNKTNIKQGFSRNIGIGIASGEFIGFVDPDDWVDLDYYEKLYLSAKVNKTDIAKAEEIKVHEEGSKHRQLDLNKRIQSGIKEGIPLCLLFDYEHCTGLYRKEILLNNGVRYGIVRNAEDIIFLLQATFFSNTISLVPNTYYYYRKHDNSTEAVREKVYYESILECFKFHVEFINNQTIEKELYDKIFLKGFEFAKARLSEIQENPVLRSYENEYINQIIDIMLLYKFDKKYLLSSYYQGYSANSNYEKIINSKLYFVARVLTWLPRKILSPFIKSS
jgi:glycosyltransferase involved in cell wall biosynthesis